MSVNPVEALPSGVTRSPGVVEAENEFVAELFDGFYKGMKRSVAVLTAFETLEGMSKPPHWSFW